MIRAVLLLAVLSAVFGAVPASSARAAEPAAHSGAPAPQLGVAEARTALAVLRDPHRRAMVEQTLEAIIRAGAAPAAKPGQAATSPPAAAPPAAAPAASGAAAAKAPVQLNPNGLGAAVLVSVSRFLSRVSDQITSTLRAVQSLPLLWGWLVVMATNPLARNLLQEAAWRVLTVFLLALAAEAVARRLFQRAIAGLDRDAAAAVAGGKAERVTEPAEIAGESGAIAPAEPAPPVPAADVEPVAWAEEGQTEAPTVRLRPRDRARRLGRAVARFLLDLLPVLAFALVGHIAAATPLGGADEPRLIVLALVDGYALWRAILCLGRLALAPGNAPLRLIRMADATSAWASRWVARIAAVAVFGYAIGQAGLLLGMSQPAYEGLLKIAGLINHLFVAVMILQKRRAVRRWLRAPEGATGPLARLRNALAPVWHWIVLALLAGEWLVWAVELRHGYSAMIHAVVVLVLVAAGTRVALIELRALLNRAMRPGPEIAERYPGLEARLAVYHPALHGLLRALVLLVGALVLLELMGVAAVGWVIDTALGQRLVGGLATIGFTVVLALIVWETTNAALQRHLTRLAREQHAGRAARMRTLVPLLRSALLVVIGVIAGLTVLSQIGIDVAPLLAGAGIVGVAIGFGSQKLVQDLITGIFLLLENAMQVGDWVTVSGLSGAVENLSVRTIRLRAGDGSVHIIPFSAVTSVTNTNRGLGNAAVSVILAFSADTDQAGAELKAIAAAMRKEAPFSGMMLSDLQLWGVDKVDGAAVTLTGQIPCTDSGRWPVQREFNRRVKMRFQELGIALYNPSQSLLMPASAAPAVPVVAARPEAAE